MHAAPSISSSNVARESDFHSLEGLLSSTGDLNKKRLSRLAILCIALKHKAGGTTNAIRCSSKSHLALKTKSKRQLDSDFHGTGATNGAGDLAKANIVDRVGGWGT